MDVFSVNRREVQHLQELDCGTGLWRRQETGIKEQHDERYLKERRRDEADHVRRVNEEKEKHLLII